jgi:hypothetical protein
LSDEASRTKKRQKLLFLASKVNNVTDDTFRPISPDDTIIEVKGVTMRVATKAVLSALLIFQSISAQAFLKSDEQSLDAVKLLIAAKSDKVTNYSAHTVHEYAVVRGVIRAYVSANGQIFAYTGHNQMGHPPSALFGPYLKEYQAAVKQAHLKYGRRSLLVNTKHIHAGITGPQGSLSWYLTLQKLPSGVTRNDIR